MKKYRIILLAAAVILLAGGCSTDKGNADITAAYNQEQDKIMADMMEAMEQIPQTESADLDFLYGMIPHHESAVEMAESYLNHAGENAEFRQLAEDITKAQDKEIKQMQDMITRIKAGNIVDKQTRDSYNEEYQAMMLGHKGHSVSADNLDLAFAQGMSMHHQMAIDMAETIAKYSTDEEMLKLANQIITVQNEEIRQMQAFIDKTGGNGAHH